MITQTVPNHAGVTVESGKDRKGPGYVVVARAWSRDLTAVVATKWARFDTPEEADAVAEKLGDANWNTIGRWHAKV